MAREYVHRAQKSAALASLLFLVVFLAGCAHSSLGPEWQGPKKPAQTRAETSWSFNDTPGRKLNSDHYTIYTTISDRELQQRLITVMEGALQQYQAFAQNIPLTDHPMPCYVFATKEQWADYTRSTAGEDAKIFLQINRGGYCLGEVFAAYDIGPNGTPSVAAHEGWHQYVSRHFIGRCPPFLEEGIATLFEDIEWVDDLPRWNIRVNRKRVQSLRRALDRKALFPLSELVMTHAGEVVGRPGHRIDTYYAQNWAFARFMWDGDDGKYRPMFQQMLADIALNRDMTGKGLISSARFGWRPGNVPPLLEHYFGMDMKQIEEAYLRFVRKVAIDDYNQQWES